MLIAAGLLALHMVDMQVAAVGDAAPAASSPAVQEVVIGDLAKPAPAPAAPGQALTATSHQPAWLSTQTVRLAVREAIASEPAAQEPPVPTPAYGADSKYRQFDRAFAYARKPDCLHPDTLKFQPAQLGQLELVGEFAIPFWIAATLRGKCNLY